MIGSLVMVSFWEWFSVNLFVVECEGGREGKGNRGEVWGGMEGR